MPAKKIPCIDAIVAASEGRIKPADAGKFLRELTRRSEQYAKDKSIPLEDAAWIVHMEEKALNKAYKAAQDRLNLANLYAQQSVLKSIKRRTKGRIKMGDAFMDVLSETSNNAHSLGATFTGSFVAALKENSLFKNFEKMSAQDMLDFTREWESLSQGGKPVTENKLAQTMSGKVRELQLQYLSRMAEHGATIPDHIGWNGPQNVDRQILREAGMTPDGREDKAKSFKWFLEQLEINGVKIDWNRMDAGETPEQRMRFLEDYHQGMYSGVHAKEREPDSTFYVNPKTGMGGSFYNRVMGERKLWLADAESQHKFNGLFAKRDGASTIVKMLNDWGRNIAVAQTLGVDAERNFSSIMQQALIAAENMEVDGPKNVDSIRSARLKPALDMIFGRGGESNALSKTFDIFRDFALVTKGINISMSIPGDWAFIASDMHQHGKGLFHAVNQLFTGHSLSGEEGKKFASTVGFMAEHRLSQIHSDRYGEADSNGNRPTKKFSEFAQTWTGVHYQTDKNRMWATHWNMELLGSLAGKTHDELGQVQRTLLMDRYDISAPVWDAIRSTAYDFKNDRGEWRIVSPDKMRELPDAAVDKLLAKEGVAEPTDAIRNTRRAELEGKIRSFIDDRVNELVPTPGLKEKMIITGGLERGTWGRELRSAFMLFKGFGITTTMRNWRRLSALYEAKQTKPLLLYAATLAAETTFLGYVTWAAREFVKGKTPPMPVDENGEFNPRKFASIMAEAGLRGGSGGIAFDYIGRDYTTKGRGFLQSVAGPILGELDSAFAAATSARKVMFGTELQPKDYGLKDLFTDAQRNIPYINSFYTKFLFDQYLMWNLKEEFSSGAIDHAKEMMMEKYGQKFIMEPVR